MHQREKLPERRPKRRRLKALGRNWMIPVCLALFFLSAWEFCVRLDSMYKPVKMFFDLVIGENIPFETAMKYFDLSILEPPLWLAVCTLISLLALVMCRRPFGSILLLPLCGALALYGLMREGTFLTDLWRLVQPGLLLIMALFSFANLICYPVRRRRFLRAEAIAPYDAPRFRDAPRLSGDKCIDHLAESQQAKKHRHDHIA
jgi:hypothetical protein